MADEQVAAETALRTAWTRVRETPLRRFLRTETGSAALLLAATALALAWANVDASSYEQVWTTDLTIRLGHWSVGQDLRGWVNSGLMTFFFFVVGLEARRELDIGELRERRRVTLPVLAGVAGLVTAALVFLAVNAGQPSAHGWGVAMSTDTAFAIGLLALVGPRRSERLRTFLLTVVVVDDVIALLVIATVYSESVSWPPLLVAAGFFAVVVLLARAHFRYGVVYFVLGLAAWLALFESGVDPLVIGLAMGLLTYAEQPSLDDLERASTLFRLFREQPTSELARTARVGLQGAVSPNERLQEAFHPWTSFLVVPVFALANAGIVVDADLIRRGMTSPITLGVVLGYVVGKPVGIVAVTWLVTRLSRGRFLPPVGWVGVLGVGTSAGVGFTVSLLVASLAFQGDQLEEATLGILLAALLAAGASWLVFRVTNLIPPAKRARAVLGRAAPLVDLVDPPDDQRDHVRGPADAPVTIVEYGDFECPYCGQAEPAVRELLAGHGEDIRYVWRHLPLTDVHPRAQLAAEASEAAERQGAFWEMHDLLLDHQEALAPPDLVRYAEQLGLDRDKFVKDLHRHAHSDRVAEDVESAAASGVLGTPTFFVNGRRHRGAYDIETLSAAVKVAKARSVLLGQD
jgi:Na+/H+ antiporter NhaA